MKTLNSPLNQPQPSQRSRMGFLASCFLTTLFASSVAHGFSSNYPAMYLRGTMNNWGTTAMTLVANNTWQTTVSFPANTAYQYKYDASGVWTATEEWGVSNIPGVGEANTANIYYTTGAAGNYVFQFNDSSLQYSITPPGIKSGEAPYGGSPAAIPGTIQAENYDTGGQGVACNVNSINGTGNNYRSDGVDLETTSDAGGGYDLGWTSGGQWFKYTVNVATAGTYTVSFRVAGPGAVTDAFHLSNSSGTNLSGSVNVPATGSYQSWTTVTASVTLPAGQQVLTLNEDNINWNLNYMSLAIGGVTTTYTINASAGANGSISPSGSVSVNQGASKLFTITPNAGYTVSSVTVDGANQGAITSFNFSNVQANHTISAAFQQQSSGEAPYGGSPAAIPGMVQAENYDTGGQGIAYNVNSIKGTGNNYRSDGVDLETTADTGGGYNLGWTSGGQWFKYTVNVATAGTYTVNLRVAGPNTVTDAFHISNSSGTNLSGSITVPATGGYQAWTTVTASVTLPAGQRY
jgi:beta-glucosidase